MGEKRNKQTAAEGPALQGHRLRQLHQGSAGAEEANDTSEKRGAHTPSATDTLSHRAGGSAHPQPQGRGQTDFVWRVTEGSPSPNRPAGITVHSGEDTGSPYGAGLRGSKSRGEAKTRMLENWERLVPTAKASLSHSPAAELEHQASL